MVRPRGRGNGEWQLWLSGEKKRKSELKKFRTGKKAHPFILGEARNTLEK